MDINPLNAKLNPICYLLALLGAHHILHFSRVRVNVTYCDHYASCGLLMFILFCVLQPMVRAIQTYQVGVTLLFNSKFLPYTCNIQGVPGGMCQTSGVCSLC